MKKRVWTRLTAAAVMLCMVVAMLTTTALAYKVAYRDGELTLSASAVGSSSYTVSYSATLNMPEDLAEAAVAALDKENMRNLRFTCYLDDALLAQATSVSSYAVAFSGSEIYKEVSRAATSSGVSITYRLTDSVLAKWKTETAKNVKAELMKTVTMSCSGTATSAQINTALASGNPIAVNGRIEIKLGGTLLSTVYGSTTMTVTTTGASAEPGAVSDPAVTGVSTLLNSDDHVAFMNGDSAGTFRPDDYILRSEVAQMFYNLLRDKNVPTTVSFSDVSDGVWYADAVRALASLGIIKGVGDNKYEPNRYITRAEFTAICARFAKASATGRSFDDVPETHWAYKDIMTASYYGWIYGVGGNNFAPNRNISRAEAATIVNRMLGRLGDKEKIDAGAGTRFPDVSDAHWAWYNIVEASTNHGFTINAARTEETWTA